MFGNAPRKPQRSSASKFRVVVPLRRIPSALPATQPYDAEDDDGQATRVCASLISVFPSRRSTLSVSRARRCLAGDSLLRGRSWRNSNSQGRPQLQLRSHSRPTWTSQQLQCGADQSTGTSRCPAALFTPLELLRSRRGGLCAASPQNFWMAGQRLVGRGGASVATQPGSQAEPTGGRPRGIGAVSRHCSMRCCSPSHILWLVP